MKVYLFTEYDYVFPIFNPEDDNKFDHNSRNRFGVYEAEAWEPPGMHIW